MLYSSLIFLMFFFSWTDNDDGELIVKSSTDFWVVGKKCDQREVYIIIHQKNANLIDINGQSVSESVARSAGTTLAPSFDCTSILIEYFHRLLFDLFLCLGVCGPAYH